MKAHMFSLIAVVLVMCMKTPAARYVNDIHNGLPDRRPGDVVCSGWAPDNGFSFSGSLSYWYRCMRRHFTGCTYVDNNLVLTWFTEADINYDFSFLRNIRYVRGHVMIAMANVHSALSLPNLEIIRANKTFEYRGQNYGLAVLMTNFTNIQMPKLKEISSGKVIFVENRRDIGVELSRDWDDIMRGRASRDPDSLKLQEGMARTYSGSQDSCSQLCPWRCYGTGESECCHSQCAGGCAGPAPTQCQICKDFSLEGECVSQCPGFTPLSNCNHSSPGWQCPSPRAWNLPGIDREILLNSNK